MGAPLAETPKGTTGDPGERTGGRGCRSMSSAPARASESRLAMLVGTDERVGALPTELREGEVSALSTSPYAPRLASSTDRELECGGM